MPNCTHKNVISIDNPTEADKQGAVCQNCVEAGTSWVHLRLCLSCGQVGCCDSSPMQHASKHAESEQHPLITSMEPGETWLYCYIDEVAFQTSRSG